ncbi:MAG: hypothetical protein CVV23_10880 [Ignavibacteriae bacterium HGW-Ignavibacteriae-2]|jgi:signal transduction histidine kinase|nr:MAG: hypothetical protein CVV23_10880 [Ignavibacteriae bacterium HGW-Ignavibacteriae-2]
MKSIGLASKLSLFIFTGIALIFLAVFVFNYNITSNIIEKKIEENAQNLAYNKINELEKVLISVEKIPESIARLLENTDVKFTDKYLSDILVSMLESNSAIFGATIALEPYTQNPNQKYMAPYIYKDKGAFVKTSLGNESYNYLNSDWYSIPKKQGKAVWSEPYFDEGGGNTIMSTYSVPLYSNINGIRKFVGIITADISLQWLNNIVSSIKIYQSGYGFLVSREGVILTHPVKEKIMNESIFGLADDIKSPQLKQIGYDMLLGKSGMAKISYFDISNGKLSWVYYTSIPNNGWSLAVVYPLEELTAEMNSLSRSLLILLVVSLSILLIAITIITKSMTKPLTELAIATTHFAKGELDIELPQIGSNDEIGNLNKAFIFMREELRHRIGELKEAYQELWVSKQRVDEYTKSLEEKVDERTKEVLIEAKELTELKSRFISMISHELRTPLYTISSSVEILQLYEKQIDEEEKKHQFKQIECAVDEIVELLNDVISINRAEIGKINLKYERFDIVDFGKSILEEVLLRFDKSPKIIFSSIKDSFEIDSDKKEIKQIISNLLINAHKYTPEDKKVYFHISKDEGLLIIEVKDEGIGIPESDKANLFEPFARGNNVAKIHGTGLGLAITKRSIETLGGAIFFQSREGVGSVFVVKIPLESVVDLKINNT